MKDRRAEQLCSGVRMSGNLREREGDGSASFLPHPQKWPLRDVWEGTGKLRPLPLQLNQRESSHF